MLFLLAAACSMLASPVVAKDANLVKLDRAVIQGAVCLDGSAPGYYFRLGRYAKIARQGQMTPQLVLHYAERRLLSCNVPSNHLEDQPRGSRLHIRESNSGSGAL